jgi:hypothetical protein
LLLFFDLVLLEIMVFHNVMVGGLEVRDVRFRMEACQIIWHYCVTALVADVSGSNPSDNGPSAGVVHVFCDVGDKLS